MHIERKRIEGQIGGYRHDGGYFYPALHAVDGTSV